MSYNPTLEASKALSLDYVSHELGEFAATGQNLSGRRFSRSPPRISSVPTTAYEESEPESPNVQLQNKESLELYNSTPGAQFAIQIEDETRRICAARDEGLLEHPNILYLEDAAEANVKYRWIQQGIWDGRWDSQPYKIWMHELQNVLPPARPSDSVKEDVTTKLDPARKRKRAELEREYHEIVQGAVNHQNRQSSRPCYQFLYQLCQEREWIKLGLSTEGEDQQTNLDTNAYGIVKSRWIRDGIWDDDWSFLPDTSWRHERPRKTLDPKERYQEDDAYKATELERAERPPQWYMMAPVAPLNRMYWPSRPFVSLDNDSDPSISSNLGLSFKVEPSLQDGHMISPEQGHTGLHGSTSKSTAESKPDNQFQESDEAGTRSAAKRQFANSTTPNPKKQVLPKQRVSARLCTADLKPSKKRTSANKEINGPPSAVVRREEPADNAATSRPRRAAASEAMKRLTKMTRP